MKRKKIKKGMSMEVYFKKLKKFEEEFEEAKNNLVLEHAESNNSVEVGDIFTDHIGSIQVESIGYTWKSGGGGECIYTGYVLKKDLTFKKNKEMRKAWQPNKI